MGMWDSLHLFTKKSNKKQRRRSAAERLRIARVVKPRGLTIEQFESRMLLSIGTWVAEGPAPINYGQAQNVAPTNSSGGYLNQVAGTIEAVVVSPTNPNVIYVGTVNGGIWETTNATSTSPTWTPLTDNQSSLSIGCMSMDPTDATGNTLVAGIGNFSTDGRQGGSLSGILSSYDGGATWTALNGGGTLNGLDIAGIAQRGKTILVAVDTATSGNLSACGIYRSTDGGQTFVQESISNGTGATPSGVVTGLPAGQTFTLAADPTNPNVFYTAVVNADTFGGQNGVYRSTNMGLTWSKVSTPGLDAYLISNTTTNVKIAVANKLDNSLGRSDNIFVGVVNQNQPTLGPGSQLAAVFFSGDGGNTWNSLGYPTSVDGGITNGLEAYGQGQLDFSMYADPTNPLAVYLGGDAQPIPAGATNSFNANDKVGRLFRGTVSTSGSFDSVTWASITNQPSSTAAIGQGTASNSAPHGSSRGMAFDASGDLIEVDGGGIYKRTNPENLVNGVLTNNVGDWYSLNGNLQITEINTVAYDDVAKVIVAATTETGAAEQTTAATPQTWTEDSEGQQSSVAVAENTPSAGYSYHYTSGPGLTNFQQIEVDSNNNVVGATAITPTIGGVSFATADGGQLYTPIIINSVNPTQMLILGAKAVYQSVNGGSTLTALTPAIPYASDAVFGGYQSGTAYPGLVWVVGTNPNNTSLGVVYLRTGAAGNLVATNYAGGPVLQIAVDPTNYAHAYVIDKNNVVWMTSNAGGTWTNITGTTFQPTSLRSVAYIPAGQTGAVLVGTNNGVFASLVSQPGTYFSIGTGLPNAPVTSMDYDAASDRLVIGTLGRGAWGASQARWRAFSACPTW